MHSLTLDYLDNLTLSVEDARTLQLLGEYKGKQELYSQQTPEILQSLKTAAIIESSESSNRLEGITAPKKRIEALVVKSAEPKDRSEREIAGYRDVLNLIHDSAEHMSLSVNVILQIHSMIYRYMPLEGGKWKNVENEIVERNTDGDIIRVRFAPVKAADTPKAMDDLVTRFKHITEINQREPLIVIPLTILDFLCVHPFLDGNGRSARLLTLMLLYHFGYKVGRYISLERIFEESKDTYYETLEASSQGWHEAKHDPFPWLNYFWGTLTRAYREFEERVGEVKPGKGSKSDHVRATIARKNTPFAISDIERDCPGISRDTIRLVLRQMKEDGSLTMQGKGRGAKWIYRKR